MLGSRELVGCPAGMIPKNSVADTDRAELNGLDSCYANLATLSQSLPDRFVTVATLQTAAPVQSRFNVTGRALCSVARSDGYPCSVTVGPGQPDPNVPRQ